MRGELEVMAERVEYALAAGVATLLLDNPPVNALGQGLRAALSAALARAAADPDVTVVVLSAKGRSWPVGADIREFGQPPMLPHLPGLCAELAAMPKPVIAALTGSALGGGLELALAASLRIASADAVLGFPEVKLGILPGAGGTQRLPRLIGAAAALEMMLSGAPVTAAQAQALGLIDKIATGDAVATAQALARTHVEGRVTLPVPARRRAPGRADPIAYLAAVAAERAVPRPAHDHAAPRIIDCVEAALLLPADEGLVFERTAFGELVGTPEAKALRHAFLAERRAAKSLPRPRLPPPALGHVAVVGAGAIGAGLATGLLTSGLHVTLIEANAQSLAMALSRVGRAQEAAVKRGELGAKKRLADWSRLKPAEHLSDLAGVDLVVEALPESEPLRVQALAQIGAELAPGVPIFSVTCGLDPASLATASGRAEAHLCLYLSEPVRQIGLVEVAASDGVGPEAVAMLQTVAHKLGWRLLRPGPRPGFLGKRLWTTLGDAADRCVAAGATPYQVDRALRAYGLPVGPYELRDRYGLDHILPSRPLRRDGVRASLVGTALVEWLMAKGRLGRRSGQGYHRYDAVGQAAQMEADVEAEVDRLRPQSRLSAGGIQRRVLAGLANDGAWALAEERVRHPSDIDLVAMAQGFPRWRGGPMQAADEAGLLGLRNDLVLLAAAGDSFWQPAPLWDDLIRNGRHFADLNPG